MLTSTASSSSTVELKLGDATVKVVVTQVQEPPQGGCCKEETEALESSVGKRVKKHF